MLRNKLLRAQGWHVVDIPYFEWNALKGQKDRSAYIRARIALELQNRKEFLANLEKLAATA